MKTKFTLIAALALVMIYAGCKKSSNAPATSTVPDSQISLQVVQNLVSILNGGFGYDPATGKIANGLKKSGSHLKVNSTTGNGCSMAFDTTLNFSEKIDTISTTMKGEIKLSAICNNGASPTITLFENYTFGLATPHISANYKLGANLTFEIADVNNSPLFTYDGNISIDADLNYLLGAKGNSKQSYAYTFHTITVDESGIKGGSADFTTTGSGSTGSWNYKGTVKFLGNNKADIVLNGKTYHVDLITGAVTV